MRLEGRNAPIKVRPGAPNGPNGVLVPSSVPTRRSASPETIVGVEMVAAKNPRHSGLAMRSSVMVRFLIGMNHQPQTVPHLTWNSAMPILSTKAGVLRGCCFAPTFRVLENADFGHFTCTVYLLFVTVERIILGSRICDGQEFAINTSASATKNVRVMWEFQAWPV